MEGLAKALVVWGLRAQRQVFNVDFRARVGLRGSPRS